MADRFSAEQRRTLADALREGETPPCPACGGRLGRREISPSRQVSYVRRRVWLSCGSCGRTATVDVAKRGDRP